MRARVVGRAIQEFMAEGGRCDEESWKLIVES